MSKKTEVRQDGDVRVIVQDGAEVGTVTRVPGGWQWRNLIGRAGVEKSERLAFLHLGFKLAEPATPPPR